MYFSFFSFSPLFFVFFYTSRGGGGGVSTAVLPTVTGHPSRRYSEQLLLVDMLLVSFS